MEPNIAQLSPEEIRVLGCLAEKEKTTPDDYPLTRNALVRACNQSTSRYPVVSYSDSEVDLVLENLKARGLVRFVFPSHGRAATRYRQVFTEQVGLSDAEMAVLTALALRGPQTVVELKTRTERTHGFAEPSDVEAVLQALAQHDPPFATRLERQPGQKELRWTHLLSGEPEIDIEPRSGKVAADQVQAAVAAASSAESQIQALTERVEALEAELASLRTQLEGALGPLE